MKRFYKLLTVVLAVTTFAAQAQINYEDPRFALWGEDAATREQNLLKNSFFREAMDNKMYDQAAGYFQELVSACPKASEAIFARGVILYKQKISRAKNMEEKKVFVDSLMIVHNLRLEHFSDHPTRGRAYILDSQARDYFNFMRSDRRGMRRVFKLAIDEGGDKVDPKLAYLYFQNLCEDYKMDLIMADDVIAEYEHLTPFFENLTGDNAKLADDFTSLFTTSGVASCENLEAIFSARLVGEAGNDEAALSKAVRLMGRLKCNSPFYVAIAENLYRIAPSANSAMMLASIFQGQNEYDKASKYLRDAVEAESDIEQRETLNARIALIEMAANRMDAAAAAARESIKTPDDTKSDNGIAYFVLAQCYAAAAANCSGFDGQATYWAAYDTMALAIANFASDEGEYKSVANQIIASYAAYFPSSEECFFREIKDGDSFTIKCGLATGVKTTVRVRK